MRLLLFLGLVGPILAAPATFSSGDNRAHLLELYSSEGCSSCPPAEAWLGNLRTAPGLWRDFVPVAFHVDYWNRLGWPDRFSSAEFTQRQYAYAGSWGSESVYTPEFVLDGVEWQSAARGLPPASSDRVGVLTVEYADSGAGRVEFSGAAGGEVYVALLGGGIVSSVRTGENAGRTLRHDFVVLRLVTAPLAHGRADFAVPRPDTTGVTQLALAVWVTARGELTPRQAAGGWLTPARDQ